MDLKPLAASQRAQIGRLDRERAGRLMGALDACNARFGRGSVVPARAGLTQQRRAWTTKFDMRTPRYTTQVDELPVVSAKSALPSDAQPQDQVRTSGCHL